MSMATIQLSTHDVERFQQRVRPALALPDAREELARLALVVELAQPHWTEPEVLVATTCLARGERSADGRRRRRACRAALAA